MSYAAPPPGATTGVDNDPSQRHGRILLPTIAVLVVLAIIVVVFTSFYTDLLWFRSMGQSSVFTTQLTTKAGLFLAFALVMAAGIGFSMVVAYRSRPTTRLRTPEQLSLERYRAGMEPLRKPLAILIPAVMGLLAGVAASAEWQTWALWRNQTPFNVTDPQFNQDLSFYIFTYPWLRFVLGFAFSLVILALLACVIVYYLYGGIRLQPPGPRVSNAAQTHISILLGLFCLLKAVGYWLDKYGLALKGDTIGNGQDFTGLKYRDLHALLPAKNILILIAIICAGIFFVNAFRRSWFVAGAGLALLLVSALVIGGIYPVIVQQFQVKPSELDKEAPSLQRNIDATRAAYGLDQIPVQEYPASPEPNAQVLAGQSGTLESIRILDPNVVSPTFTAKEQYRGFYKFADELNVDRYQIGDAKRGAVVATRELNLGSLPNDQRNWTNDHLVYTHGYGFVGAYDNVKQPDGSPVFFEGKIPSQGALDVTQPRIYFGQSSPEYSIVGGSPDAPRELDYQSDSAPNGQANNNYDGTGGVPVGSAINRFLFAVKFMEPNIVLSSQFTDDARIMWDRDPRTIVGKVAPWLELDTDPYPVVVDGRVKWIVDGYTTSDEYPYATRESLPDAISDSTVPRVSPAAIPKTQINYIRNSVKAVVDAYDGNVDLYSFDDQDPILQTWEKVFPGVVKPESEMPAELQAHVRYPQDIFKIQRQMFSKYHVVDPRVFYNGQDFWSVPNDPTQAQNENLYQPPYYLTLQMPGETKPGFALTTTYAPVNRQTLAAFMSANSTPGPDYGKLTVLQLPRDTIIAGPKQVQNNFDSNPNIASRLTLLRSQGSSVELGNLLSLPVGGGMLYVEPVYVQGGQQGGFPLLQLVIAGFGEKSAMADTLPEALRLVGVVAGPKSKPNGGGVTPAPVPDTEASLLAELNAALAEARTAYDAGQAALKAGNFAAYGEQQARLDAALQRAQKAQTQLDRVLASNAAAATGSTTTAASYPGGTSKLLNTSQVLTYAPG